jgi:hypothetical protein
MTTDHFTVRRLSKRRMRDGCLRLGKSGIILPRSIEYLRAVMRSVPLELGVVLFKIPAVVPQTTKVSIRGS